MTQSFNDLSIRSKMIVIVSGIVATLTMMMVVVVWWKAKSEVQADIANELSSVRENFMLMERERLHQQLAVATGVVDSGQAREILEAGNVAQACDFVKSFLPRKDRDVGDTFDVAALLQRDGVPFVSVRPNRPCARPATNRPWRSARNEPSITNWESPDGAVTEAATVPIIWKGQFVGAFVLGRQVSDALASHVREHTGRDVFFWHLDHGVPHLLAASNPEMKQAFEAALKQALGAASFQLPVHGDNLVVMDATLDRDIVTNPEQLRLALAQSESEKLRPFRNLEIILLVLAAMALVFGTALGMFLSQPIADPIINLATAADSVAKGDFAVLDSLVMHLSARLHNRDEVGTLGRSFVSMVRGLKERLAMSHFVSDATEHLIREQLDGKALDHKENVAVFFSDVRQFSSFAEQRDPELVIATLNRVLGLQAEIVRNHGGDIDKYVGDAVVALFHGPDRFRKATAAALECAARLETEFGGQDGTRVGFGINAGEVVMGCIGSEQRREYTAIGRTVNLAARLCSAARAFQVLVTEQIAMELPDTYGLQALEPIRFKGFSQPVPIFEVSTPTFRSVSAD